MPAVVLYAEASHPTIENLDHVRAGAHLLGCVLRRHRDQLGEQLVPGRRLAIHHLLGIDVIARTAALDHVAGEREGRAAESDDGQVRSEMLGHQTDCFCHIAQIGSRIRAQAR